MRTIYPRSRGRVALCLLATSALMAVAVVPPVDRDAAAVPPSERAAAVGPAADSYYMVIYSAEKPNTPTMSHCFATFARIGRAAGASGPPRVDLHHINWFSVRGHRCGSTFGLVECDGRPTRPEPGENRTTRDALELVLQGGRRVTRWGPYEIDRGLYERALRHIDLLEGRVPGRKALYKAIDLGYRHRPDTVVLNCIHAVSDIVREPAPLRTWTTYGDEAARKVVQHLRPWIKGPAVGRSDVWPAIWEAIWRGATAPSADTIVRADFDPGTGDVVQAPPIEAAPGPLSLSGAGAPDAGPAGRSGADATAGGG